MHERAGQNQMREAFQTEAGERRVVGVNCFDEDVSAFEVDGFAGGSDAWERAMGRLSELRATRDANGARAALQALEDRCRSDDNIVPAMLEALSADCSIGEVGEVYRNVFGEWRSPIPL